MKKIFEKGCYALFLKYLIQTMRIFLLLFFIGINTILAETYSQETRLSIQLNNVSVEELFSVIEENSEYIFLYKENVPIKVRVSVNTENETLDEILDQALTSHNITYHINDRQVIVARTPFLKNEQEHSLQENKKQITGIVIDERGEPIIGANIVEKGTMNGVTTDMDGKFSLSIGENAVLQISYIGYLTQEIAIHDQSNLRILLQEDFQTIEEIVVTALGIKKEAKSLSYSTSNIKGEDVASAHETNVANALSGKVAGVFVSRPASGAGGSSKVLIRGNNSLRTNSQPLYVIDGVPINNTNTDNATVWGGFDYGDGTSNINPDDIESMSVLKGPNATALYGQRGNNGVILITTKSGKRGKKVGITFSSDFSFGSGLVLPDFQNVYGMGYDGDFTHFRGDDGVIYSKKDADASGISGVPKTSNGRDQYTRGSWGPKMEGQVYEDAYGHTSTFDPQPNTYDFFDTERTFTNNLGIDGGTEKMAYRFSYSNTHNNGYVPKNKLNRNTFTLKVNSNITDNLQFEAMVNYINQKVKGRPNLSDSSNNPAYLFVSMPRSLSLASLAQYSWTEEEIERQLGFSSGSLFPGLEKTYATNQSTANPYWTIDRTHNEDERDRIIGYFKATYSIFPWLQATAKTGIDYFYDRRLYWQSQGTWHTTNKNGAFREYEMKTKEINSDFMLSSNFKIGEDFDISLNFGGNRQEFHTSTVGSSGTEFIVPDLHVINNIKTVSYISALEETKINSLYGSGQVAYKNYLYVDFSGRNDWSSTLPIKNSSFFYPSLGASFLLSEALNLNNKNLNFLKLRASVAQAGSSGAPYQLMGTYFLNAEKHAGVTLGQYTSTVVDPNIKNELTTSYEGGFDVNLFSNRLALNFTYYNASTKNQILSIPLPSSTTFTNRIINAGKIQNKGVEFMISGTPIQTKGGFTWDTSFNFSRNRNKVIELAEGIDTYQLASDRGVAVVAETGKPFGQIKGTKFAWLKDEQGNKLIDPDTGLPLRSAGFETTDLGTALPDWLGGFSNTFSYKGFRLYMLIDISQGGKVFSQSMREAILYGTTMKTVQGRDGTFVADGMVAKQDASGSYVSTGAKNTKQVNAQDYWNVVASDKESFVSEEMINDLSYISMREITLSYTIPSTVLEKTVINNLTVSAYGRNLFYFQRNTDGFSPEACSFNVKNTGLGIESTSLPMMRTFGVNVSIGF